MKRTLLVSLVILIPLLGPYLQVQQEQGFSRNLAENQAFSASLKLYSQVSPQNLLYGGILSPSQPVTAGCYPLDNLFPGIMAAVLALVGVLSAKNGSKWFFILLFALAFGNVNV